MMGRRSPLCGVTSNQVNYRAQDASPSLVHNKGLGRNQRGQVRAEEEECTLCGLENTSCPPRIIVDSGWAPASLAGASGAIKQEQGEHPARPES